MARWQILARALSWWPVWGELSIRFERALCLASLLRSPFAAKANCRRVGAHLMLVASGFAVVALTARLHAQQRVQAPTGPNGSWNVYDVISENTNWIQAVNATANLNEFGVPGHLVEIESPGENQLVEYFGAGRTVWLGLTDREGMAPLVNYNGQFAPQESQNLPSPATQGWAWLSGKIPNYFNWSRVDPSNSLQAEDAAWMKSDGRWEDAATGLGANEPIEPTLQPTTSLTEIARSAGAYVVEYSTQADAPFPNIPIAKVPSRMPSLVNLPAGQAGLLDVTEYHVNQPLPTHILPVSQLITEIQANRVVAETYHAQISRADMSDPDADRQGGPIVKDQLPFAHPSGVIGGRDGDTLSIARGVIHVPVSGTYTFQVYSSDGFAMRIGDHAFSRAAGVGMIDAIDPRVFYFPGLSGGTDARAIIDLPAGDHEFNFLNWSSGKSSTWEVTTAQGEFDNPLLAQWIAIGDDVVLPEVQRIAPLQLVGLATVANLPSDLGGRSEDLEEIRDTMTAAIHDGTAIRRDDVGTLVLYDEDGVCCGLPGSLVDPAYRSQWPIFDPAVGGEPGPKDNFSSMITGTLVADDGDDVPGEDVQLTLEMFVSDGAQLHIQGVDFLDYDGAADIDTEVDGDVVLSVNSRGNNQAFGTVVLREGVSYQFDALHYEVTRDADFELWAALGDQIGLDFDPLLYAPVSSVLTSQKLAANQGLRLVAPLAPLAGDFNHNGLLDGGDLDLLADATAVQDLAFDLDNNQIVDPNDRSHWIHEIKGTHFGDANLDGVFNSSDLIDMFQAGKYEQGVVSTWSDGDFDGDRRFESSDLIAAFQDGAYTQLSRVKGAQVPEPRLSAYWLLAITSSLVGRLRMRRRREV